MKDREFFSYHEGVDTWENNGFHVKLVEVAVLLTSEGRKISFKIRQLMLAPKMV